MNKKAVFLAIITLSMFFVAGNLSAQTTSFEPIVQGQSLPDPIDLDKLDKCIRLSLAKHNWVVSAGKPGEILAYFEKSEGLIRADIKVAYSAKGYTIEYVDSKGLDVNLEKKIIHRNYPRWIANLNKAIFMMYLQ